MTKHPSKTHSQGTHSDGTSDGKYLPRPDRPPPPAPPSTLYNSVDPPKTDVSTSTPRTCTTEATREDGPVSVSLQGGPASTQDGPVPDPSVNISDSNPGLVSDAVLDAEENSSLSHGWLLAPVSSMFFFPMLINLILPLSYTASEELTLWLLNEPWAYNKGP